jgi:formylmethanofuran dehydrogenase subunit D
VPEQFILIPGRTSRQGTSLNEGKSSAEYLEETRTLQMSPTDMRRLQLAEGTAVRVWNDVGSVVVPVKAAKGDELPGGMLFISYGDVSSRLMGRDTHGSGMPDSKGLDVWLERAAAAPSTS